MSKNVILARTKEFLSYIGKFLLLCSFLILLIPMGFLYSIFYTIERKKFSNRINAFMVRMADRLDDDEA